MGIYYLIVAFFVIYMFINYKKALYLWAVFSLAMHLGICVKFTPPAISVLFVVNLAFVLYFYIFKRKTVQHQFVLSKLFKFTVVSSLLTAFCLFSFAAASKEIISAINTIVNTFSILYLLDYEIRSSRDIQSICRILYGFMFISIVYGLYVVSTVTNPVIEWEQSLIPASMANKLVASTETFRGVKAQSFFGGATQFSAFVYLTAVIYIALQKAKKDRLSYISLLILLTAVFICFLSKTRAAILAGLCSALYIIIKQKSTTKLKVIFFLLVALPLIYPFFEDNLSFVTSIYDSNAQDEVGGSSMEMRLMQTQVVADIASANPIFGIGTTGYANISALQIDGLYGAESVWFHLLMERGLIGVCVYIYIFYYTVKSISKERKKYMIMAALFWLILHTLSTTGLSEYFYMFTFLILRKLDTININTKFVKQ